MPNLTILYGSMTGNTEAVIYKVDELLTSKEITFTRSRSEDVQESVIDSHDLFLFATSTWEGGSMNPFFEVLYEYIKANNMKGKKAVFIGLGDRSYDEENFNKAIKDLKQAFITSGGSEIGETLIIDGDPYALLETEVTDWLNNIVSKLEK